MKNDCFERESISPNFLFELERESNRMSDSLTDGLAVVIMYESRRESGKCKAIWVADARDTDRPLYAESTNSIPGH